MTKRSVKVLIVDDSDVIKKSLKDFFRGYDFHVFTCSDGLEGIRLAAEKKPDLIFLDLMMPNVDGIKMLEVKNVISEIKHIPVIVISGNTVKSNVIAAMEAGATKVISKPIDERILKEAVNEILEGDYFQAPSVHVIPTEKSREIKNDLLKIFLEKYPEIKHKIADSLRRRDPQDLKNYVHQIKGTGATIGYPELTDLAQEVMNLGFVTPSDWVFAEIRTSQIFRKVEEIKKQLRERI
jgi:CheY-like chemotaxis protein